jgi:hypothetical protein
MGRTGEPIEDEIEFGLASGIEDEIEFGLASGIDDRSQRRRGAVRGLSACSDTWASNPRA